MNGKERRQSTTATTSGLVLVMSLPVVPLPPDRFYAAQRSRSGARGFSRVACNALLYVMNDGIQLAAVHILDWDRGEINVS